MLLNELLEKPVAIQEINSETLSHKNISLFMLRLDEIHKEISGNKLFKLYYFLKRAIATDHKTILTFGGAYSNHLIATAFACKKVGVKSIGIVRGEKPEKLSSTLLQCLDFGMQIKFVDRKFYKVFAEKTSNELFRTEFGDHLFVPMGGYGKEGAKGASLISDLIPKNQFTHICIPVGTATTLSGLLLAKRKEKIVAFPALKGLNDIPESLAACGVEDSDQLIMINDYHFEGFAKKNDQLLDFMNEFYLQNQIPLDFVYTGKMMFGVMDLLQKGFFSPGSKVLCLHTGGLQGNQSLSKNDLCY